jgi:hypothetical protein
MEGKREEQKFPHLSRQRPSGSPSAPVQLSNT